MTRAARETETVVRLRDVRVRFGATRVLAIDDLTVAAGEEVAVIGPSGSGKTTLLRLVNGYVPWLGGTVEVLGHRFDGTSRPRPARGDRALRRRLGFVFQSFHLVERASVLDNVLAGRLGHAPVAASLAGRFGAADLEVVRAAIDEVELGERAFQRVDTLSGGQQQRVGVARAIAQEPDILLADEPVSNLDPRLADEILELLVTVARRHEATLVMSVHQPELARRFTRRVIGLREGRVVWDGGAEQLDGDAVEEIFRGRNPGRARASLVDGTEAARPIHEPSARSARERSK